MFRNLFCKKNTKYYLKTIETLEVKFLEKEFLKVFEFRQLYRISSIMLSSFCLTSYPAILNRLVSQSVDKAIAPFSLITLFLEQSDLEDMLIAINLITNVV